MHRNTPAYWDFSHDHHVYDRRARLNIMHRTHSQAFYFSTWSDRFAYLDAILDFSAVYDDRDQVGLDPTWSHVVCDDDDPLDHRESQLRPSVEEALQKQSLLLLLK